MTTSEFGHDAWADLATPVVPVTPSPAFTTRLRALLERALRLPPGVSMSDLTELDPQQAPRSAAIPYLSVQGAREAITWYSRVFGARLVGDPIVMPDERVGHSELEIDGGVFSSPTPTRRSVWSLRSPARPPSA